MGDVGSPPRARPRRFVLKPHPRTWLSHFANEALVCGDCMTNAPHEERASPSSRPNYMMNDLIAYVAS